MRTLVCTAALFILLAPALRGSIVTSHISTDAEMLAQIEDLAFTCEGRIGDRAGAATYERDINTGEIQGQYDWPNSTPVNFSVTYDNLTNLLRFAVGGQTLEYYPLLPFTEVYIRTRAVNAGTSILVDSLVLNGSALTAASHALASAGGLDILWVRGFDDPSLHGFSLAGQSTMDWGSGPVPTQSRLAYQVKFAEGPQVPEPATLLLALIGVAAVSAARRRTKR